MDTETKQFIKNRITELPEKLRTFVEGETWREGVVKLARQFNLKEEQATNLENEVFLTLLCFEPPGDFKENIKREVGLDENAGRRIADSINGSVFAGIMSEIKNAWGGNPANTTAQVVPQPFTPIDTLSPEKMQQAMRPAGTAPANLPVEGTAAEEKRVSHDYTNKIDPYREPLE